MQQCSLREKKGHVCCGLIASSSNCATCVQVLCTPVRQAVAWFDVAYEARQRGDFALDSFPCFIISKGGVSWYGFLEHGTQPGGGRAATN